MKKNPEDEDTSEYSEEEEEEEVEEEDEDVDDDAFASEGQDKFPDTLDYGRNKQEYEQLYSMSQGHQGSGQAQESSLVAQFFKRFFVITSLLIFVKFAYPVVMVHKDKIGEIRDLWEMKKKDLKAVTTSRYFSVKFSSSDFTLCCARLLFRLFHDHFHLVHVFPYLFHLFKFKFPPSGDRP